MFGKIKEFFEGETTLEVDQSGEPTPQELQIATAVLLLEMAGADEDFDPEEVRTCFKSLENQFNVEDSETLEIFEKAESLRQEKGKIDHFVELVNQHFNVKQKQIVLGMVWRVVLADEIIDNYEQKFASQLRTRLQLSREQAEEAKQLAIHGNV